ncbi:MAG: M48 family metallopeptidase [Zoogloeaceae bacterium]|nr:M48 family metallopeptidase [Zoogloeaceae bacterium]
MTKDFSLLSSSVETMPYWQLRISARARRMHLKVTAEAVSVVLPQGHDPQAAARFVAQNRAWIVRQQVKLRTRAAARQAEVWPDDEILLRGTPVKVQVAPTTTWLATDQVAQTDDCLLIRRGARSRKTPAQALEVWLREAAGRAIGQIVTEVQPQFREHPRRIAIKDQKSRWGSCSAQGNLAFNWRLVMAPDFVLRYVVIHEMAHLAILNHSPTFWQAVERRCPEMDKAKQWLKKHGRRLFAPLPGQGDPAPA